MKLEPPTRKMGLEETLALTPSLSPSAGERVPEGRERRRFMGRGKHAQFPEFSRALVLELLHGNSRRLLQGTSIFSTRLSERRTLPRRSIHLCRSAQSAGWFSQAHLETNTLSSPVCKNSEDPSPCPSPHPMGRGWPSGRVRGTLASHQLGGGEMPRV